MLNLTIRSFEPEDTNFIYSSWLKSYRQSDFSKKTPNNIYYTFQKSRIDRLAKDATILIACSPDNPQQIYGYAIGTSEVFHYVYVKYTYRKLGVAKRLLEILNPKFGETPIICSHCSNYWSEHSNKYKLTYNPYL